MKMKKIMGLIATCCSMLCFGIGIHSFVAEASVTVPSLSYDVFSGLAPLKIYSDPACTQDTGAVLDTGINAWKVTRESDTAPQAVDLGHNQWVKRDEVYMIYGRTNADVKASEILFAYSAGKAVPIYDTPQLVNEVGHLNTSIQKWAITQYAARYMTATALTSVDLGHHQWVDARSVDVIYNYGHFNAGTITRNLDGTSTGQLQASDFYRIFDATTINGKTFVRLGTNTQWVNFEDFGGLA